MLLVLYACKGQTITSGVLSQELTTLCSETGSPLGPEFMDLASLTEQQVPGFTCPSTTSAGVTSVYHH